MAKRLPCPTTIDFETRPIGRRPEYPPVPVGVAIKPWKRKARYLAWGHPEGNNCTLEQAKKELRKVWEKSKCLLFHNAKFDVDVAETHMGCPRRPWHAIHDTLFLLFLHDPDAKALGLKEAAEALLSMPPEERDAVSDWLVERQPVEGRRLTPKAARAWICLAPGELVGRYAIGDVERTELLYRALLPEIERRGMSDAYDRERRLLPILLDAERRGMRVDAKRLAQEIHRGNETLGRVEGWLRRKLGDVNLDANAAVGEALVARGYADAAAMGVTKTGKLATHKDAIARGLGVTPLAGVLRYRNALCTCLRTFMEPWLEMAYASSTGDRIYTEWSQVRRPNEREAGLSGARTGRLSSSPNFQNLPKPFGELFHSAEGDGLPRCPIKGLPPLPEVRSFVVPDEGRTLIDRDYSQQELRILAHFEGGALQTAYEENPWLDVHEHARRMINRMLATDYARGLIKTIGFGLIYGMGVASMAEKAKTPLADAAAAKRAYLAGFSGLKDMQDEMRRRAAAGEPIRTWGGREYYCEPPRLERGEVRTFDYKLVNRLVQGSAADATKEATIRAVEALAPLDVRFVLTVHDELMFDCPDDRVDEAMQVLSGAMASLDFDVQMLSEGKLSKESWAAMKPYDKAGERVVA